MHGVSICVCVRKRDLTCADHSFDLDARGVQLLGELMHGPVGVFVGFGVDVGFGAWKFNCRRVRGFTVTIKCDGRSQLARNVSEMNRNVSSTGTFPGWSYAGRLGVPRTGDVWGCRLLPNGCRKSGALFVLCETRLGFRSRGLRHRKGISVGVKR